MQFYLYAGFVGLILLLLALDLGVFNRKAHVIGVREALLWTVFWVAISLGFNVAVYFIYQHHLFGIGTEPGHYESGYDAAKKFFLGYLIEKSLSLDNIFVMAVIFEYFRIPPILQHRTLFWGIVGALLMRGGMIAAGTVLIQKFHNVIYVFGALLILTAVKMLLAHDKEMDPSRNPLVRLARRIYPVSDTLVGQHFFTRVSGKKAVTPLFLALLVIESTDVLFAIDSIPAIFAITADPFIVFTSNMFAILGLRSLYFALAAMLDKFHYMKYSLVFLLAFVGVKMLIQDYYKIDANLSLIIILAILGVGVLASVLRPAKPKSAVSPKPFEVQILDE